MKELQILQKRKNEFGVRTWHIQVGDEKLLIFEEHSIPYFYVYAPLAQENEWFLEWLRKMEFELMGDFMDYMEKLQDPPIKLPKIEDEEV